MRGDGCIGKMVEIQNISINDMTKDEKEGYVNEIRLTPTKLRNSKNLASESELHRILLHLYKEVNGMNPEINNSGYQVVPYLFTLDVGKNVARYNELIKCSGEIYISNLEYELDADGNKIFDSNNRYKLKETSRTKYVSAFCGAGHSRTQKNLFVDASMMDKLNDILLCGMSADLEYDRPSKWNAYYAMVTTDSSPVQYMPNIVVVPDYEKTVQDIVDVVEVSGKGNSKEYRFKKDCIRELPILPFDGAGLVTPECARRWANELGCQSKKGESYLPSCFQFRAIPGIKGELMVFDLREFAREHNLSKIVDLGGREWDIFEDNIDVVLTASQFKFWKQYCDKNGNFDYLQWRNAFDEVCHGYRRTFNIVSYASHPDDLRNNTMLSYQPLQTVNFTEDEIEKISSKGLNIYRRVTSDVDEFLKYRQLISLVDDEEVENVNEYTPPYYRALLQNRELFKDKYIRGKIQEDIKKLKNNLLSGKVFVRGNYQVFTPDLYGLAEWAFRNELGHKPEGLLKNAFDIYSAWWINKSKEEEKQIDKVDIIRNPAVGMEHRIGYLQDNPDLRRWYKYQNIGIVTSMYDTLALVLGNADFDGDTICTTDNKQLIDAVKRERTKGHGNLVWKEVVDNAQNDSKQKTLVSIKDTAALMKVNQMSFGNSIGSVIDRVTDLWSAIKQDEDLIRKYIAFGVVVGGETIDFAKTGEKASFPADVEQYFKGIKRGHWMRYLPKHQDASTKEQRAIKNAKFFGKSEQEIQRLVKFEDYDCNMNHLCHHAEKVIDSINCKNLPKKDDFDFTKMIGNTPVIKKELLQKVKDLQEEYQELSSIYRKESVKSKSHQKSMVMKYRWFYDRCRAELLSIEPDINALLDALIMIYYGVSRNSKSLMSKEKDILWNAFPEETIAKCSGGVVPDIDTEKIEKYRQKNEEYKRKEKANKAKKKKVAIKSIDNSNEYREKVVTITKAERKQIDRIIEDAFEAKLIENQKNTPNLKRVLAVLIFLSRKFENHTGNPHYFTIQYNVPDEITNTTLGKLASVSHKEIDAMIKFLMQLDVVRCNVTSKGVKIKVLFPHCDGEDWIAADDYNKAATQIRSHFRDKKL